jgi:phage portal protein BeeE
MTDALTKAFAEADRMVFSAKSAALSVSNVMTSGSRINNRTLSIPSAQEQFLHFRGWVWSAVRLVAQRIAGQAVCVGRRPSRGRRFKNIGEHIEPMENHRVLDALSDPNDLQTYWQLMFSTVASLEITGRALWWISQGTRETADGPGTSIMHIPTTWLVSVDPKRTVWKIRPTGSVEEFEIPGDQVCDYHYPDPSDPNGVISPLTRVAEAVLTDQQIQTAQHMAFRNGIFPRVVLTAGKLPGTNGVPGERPVFSPQQREDLIAAIKGAYQGVTSSDEPVILDGLIESITKFSQTSEEMDWMQSSKLTKARVLQAYGVSPILLGEIENANRASSIVANEIFVENKCNPLIELISGSMTEWLAPMFSGPRERLVCWIEPAVAHDPDINLKQWELGAKLGFVTKNEYRHSILNLPDATDGDVFLEPAGFLPSEPPKKHHVNGRNRIGAN